MSVESSTASLDLRSRFRHTESRVVDILALWFQEPVQLASIPELEISLGRSITPGRLSKVMQNGWTRYRFPGRLRSRSFILSRDYEQICEPWLSQANYLFSRLQITTHLEDYGVVTGVSYWIILSENGTGDPPVGYLFLCPTTDLETGPSSFRWPACPAYWSRDPSGIQHLSTEEANRLGFPCIQLETELFVSSWDASVYAGLREFHHAKGFDPDSQDLARHLGYPLFQLTSETEAPFAHVTDVGPDSGADDENKAVKDEAADAEEDSHQDKNSQMPSVEDHGAINMLLCYLTHVGGFRIL
ncbi:hypothetical protein DFH06DRAFT_511072 [Mycena polygramma]|nr:hypothetical protein DFH06DRAFT_511072 [Mycena polygramma]